MADNAGNTEIKIGSKTNEEVTCAQCAKTVPGSQAYTYQGKDNTSIFLCETCRSEAEKSLQAETKDPNVVMAVLCGCGAGIVAGFIWSLITIVTGYQIGYIALGVGFIIGWAVVWGSGMKRGAVLQVISAVITLASLFFAEYFMVLHSYRQYMLEHQAEFPDYSGGFFLLPVFHPDVLGAIVSPMGLVIWGIGIYFAYSIPKSRSV